MRRLKQLIMSLILTFVCFSCSENISMNNSESQKKEVKKVTLDTITSVHTELFKQYEVVGLDTFRNQLSRIFIVMDSQFVYDTLFVNDIISEIKSLYRPHKQTDVSFFINKKYADYKSSLFIEEGHRLSIEEYDNWRNYYYLAEYNFESQIYITYPSCQYQCDRKKEFKIGIN